MRDSCSFVQIIFSFIYFSPALTELHCWFFNTRRHRTFLFVGGSFSNPSPSESPPLSLLSKGNACLGPIPPPPTCSAPRALRQPGTASPSEGRPSVHGSAATIPAGAAGPRWPTGACLVVCPGGGGRSRSAAATDAMARISRPGVVGMRVWFFHLPFMQEGPTVAGDNCRCPPPKSDPGLLIGLVPKKSQGRCRILDVYFWIC